MKRGIDHLVLSVSDIERAAEFYRRLGFTTTPRAQHPWGTDNSLVQLNGSFLELLAVTRPELVPPSKEREFSFGEYNHEFLSHREGMSMLVFESTDAKADREEFISRGLRPFDNFHFERLATLPDGAQVTVAFTLAFATDPRMPEAVFFCCQQHAPQYFWRPEYQTHENGADAVVEVIMVADQPIALADFFSKVQESESIEESSFGLAVNTPRGTIRVCTQEDVCQHYGDMDLSSFPESPYFLGFAVHVPDPGRVAAHFRSNNVAFDATPESIRVSPKDAFGVLIEFRS